MSETVRFGVSLDADLLQEFDKLCTRKEYPSRSEALRDIIREALMQDSLQTAEDLISTAVLTLIYDHHSRDLSRKLTEIQHDVHDLVVASLHVHLDHHNCMETLLLKGKSVEIYNLANKLRSVKGVTHGTFSMIPLKA